MRILVVDNYDSFTYNLVHALSAHDGVEVNVERNDAVSEISLNSCDAIVLSPGPGIPEEAGQCLDIIQRFAGTKKMLGVCLGHQAMAVAFGGKLKNLPAVKHGIATEAIRITHDPLLNDISEVFTIGHYHSWVAAKPLPAALEILATDRDGEVMAFRHCTYNMCGVQFHPESILTPDGPRVLSNWLKR
jgi:anthranilate synthase component II